MYTARVFGLYSHFLLLYMYYLRKNEIINKKHKQTNKQKRLYCKRGTFVCIYLFSFAFSFKGDR